MQYSSTPPSVLVIAGNDPSGGAGLAADLQAISALGGHPAPVVTALTVQDTRNAYQVASVDATLVTAQAEAVLGDLAIRAIKIGLLATAEIAHAVADVLDQNRGIPVVLDPVLVAAGGADLAEESLVSVLLKRLLPMTTVLTPNALEIRRLAPAADDRETRARTLLKHGCRYVLVKGADEDTPGVENVLFGADGFVESFRWRRLPDQYHGSGCTLAAAIAALLAAGRSVPAAVTEAQRYTWASLRSAFRPGGGQLVPRRLHDADGDSG